MNSSEQEIITNRISDDETTIYKFKDDDEQNSDDKIQSKKMITYKFEDGTTIELEEMDEDEKDSDW